MKLIRSFILCFTLLLAFQIILPREANAAAACQITYGGGQVCQGQSLLRFSYPAPTIQPLSTSSQIPTDTKSLLMQAPKSLPSTGPSAFGYLFIVFAGITGIAIHLFLL